MIKTLQEAGFKRNRRPPVRCWRCGSTSYDDLVLDTGGDVIQCRINCTRKPKGTESIDDIQTSEEQIYQGVYDAVNNAFPPSEITENLIYAAIKDAVTEYLERNVMPK
jgi:hypothetical protein